MSEALAIWLHSAIIVMHHSSSVNTASEYNPLTSGGCCLPTLTFHCSCICLMFRWFLGGELLTNKGANSSVLELSSVTRDLHRATVVCEAVNKAGRAQQSIVLDILCEFF